MEAFEPKRSVFRVGEIKDILKNVNDDSEFLIDCFDGRLLKARLIEVFEAMPNEYDGEVILTCGE